MPVSSKIFIKNRALGYVSNHVPCVIRFSTKRSEYLISTCVGKAFHTYGSEHLKLLTVSDTTEEDITCMATDNSVFYTACGNKFYAWKRNAVIKFTFEGHNHPIHLLVPFGKHVISVDDGNTIKVWEHRTQENILTLDFGLDTFKISAIMHPLTHLNKFLLGSEQGMMQLWNIKTSKLIYTFNGWGAPITILQQSPAIDVVAVGLNDGKIILHNIKYDETVVDFKQDYGPVTSIAFRTDNMPIMVTGSPGGNIVLWDLEERKVVSQIINAHDSTVSSMICFSNEPIMVTSSPDNTLKMWIFDQPDHGGRLLRFREGHSAQPTHIRFYGRQSNHILSAGTDSTLRVFNTISESMNYSLGRASFDRKTMLKKKYTEEYLLMPPITEFSTSLTREKEWDNITATHLGLPIVTSWTYEKRRMGSHKLLPERLLKKTRAAITDSATSIHMTNCGNFVVIGYSSGHVDRFNIQSGIQRCTYGSPSAHKGSIRGVAVDTLNQMVISGCNNGYLKFWQFPPVRGTKCRPKSVDALTLGEGVSFFRMHDESSLIGVILENFVVIIVDTETRRIVRRLSGHTGQITDGVFSPDARWIITSSMDKSIRTWDIPTSSLVDIFKVESPCTSISISPTGQYLATAHVNYLGIYLWINRTLFSHVYLKPITDLSSVPMIDLPGTGVEETIQLDDLDEEDTLKDGHTPHKIQIENLITLSNQATSRWKNLLDIDVIKKRNKPKEPPKAPPKAPFFLPTLPGKDIVFDLSAVELDDEGTKMLRMSKVQNYTIFGQALINTVETKNFLPVIEKLKSLSPSGLDFEINSLGMETYGSCVLFQQFLSMIEYMFSMKLDFELAQAYLGLFLKAHDKALLEEKSLIHQLKSIQEAQIEGWNKLENDLMYCLGVINILK